MIQIVMMYPTCSWLFPLVPLERFTVWQCLSYVRQANVYRVEHKNRLRQRNNEKEQKEDGRGITGRDGISRRAQKAEWQALAILYPAPERFSSAGPVNGLTRKKWLDCMQMPFRGRQRRKHMETSLYDETCSVTRSLQIAVGPRRFGTCMLNHHHGNWPAR